MTAEGSFGSAAEPDGVGAALGLDPERGAVRHYPRGKDIFPNASSAGRKRVVIVELFSVYILGR